MKANDLPLLVRESPRWFECEGDALLGIVARPLEPERERPVALLIAVGGPQYRVGSHRQFTLLARAAAAAGYCTLRFDYRGMGDSEGDMRAFDDVQADYQAAVNLLAEAAPGARIVLWGLCDAASAALMFGASDPRVAGVVLLNPWVRSTQSLASTHVKHYYRARLLDPGFWMDVLRGRVPIARRALEFARSLITAARKGETTTGSFQDRMRDGLRRFGGPMVLVLSGRDITAREFEEYARTEATWAGLLDAVRVERAPDADHTFSSAEHRRWVEATTLTALDQIARR